MTKQVQVMKKEKKTKKNKKKQKKKSRGKTNEKPYNTHLRLLQVENELFTIVTLYVKYISYSEKKPSVDFPTDGISRKLITSQSTSI